MSEKSRAVLYILILSLILGIAIKTLTDERYKHINPEDLNTVDIGVYTPKNMLITTFFIALIFIYLNLTEEKPKENLINDLL